MTRPSYIGVKLNESIENIHQNIFLSSPSIKSRSGYGEITKVVRQHGYLMRKNIFRGYKTHYYSINYYSSKLYCFTDYNDFSLWNSQGQPRSTSVKRNDPSPDRIYHIVAVDEDTTKQWKLILSVRKKTGSTKVDKIILIAESSDDFNEWIMAFHDVLQRTCDRQHSAISYNDDSGSGRHTITKPDGSRVYATTPPPRQFHEGNEGSLSARGTSSRRTMTNGQTDSVKTINAETNSQPRNVVLIGSANGFTVGVSEAKLSQAKYELSQLLQEPGTRLPYRGIEPTSGQHTDWLHGIPDFTLTDLAYLKGRSRWHDSNSIANAIETILRVFVMEIEHKPNISQWESIAPSFWCQSNDSAPISFEQMASLRLSCLGLVSIPLGSMDLVADVFASGFPLEVLQVYTERPSIYFSWRQWGKFCGTFDGRRGDGQMIELTGFGHMMVDLELMKMHSLHLFSSSEPLFSAVHR